MNKSRNRALALALVGLAVLFYAVTYVRMQQTEEKRHVDDPKAHSTEQGSSRPGQP